MHLVTDRVRGFLKSKRRQILLFLLALVLGVSCGMFVRVQMERQKLIDDFERLTDTCQESLFRTYTNLGKGRDFFPHAPRRQISYLVYACNAVHASGSWKLRDRLRYGRPCITYINHLKDYLLDNELDDADAFYLRTRPFLEAHFDGSVWDFLNNLDAELQTSYGQQAVAALSP